MTAHNLGTLPTVPVKHADFITSAKSFPHSELGEYLKPFSQYDARLREIFAQEPENPILSDNTINLTPIFHGGHEIDVTIRARNLSAESNDEKERYIMPLKEADRKLNKSPAIVPSFKEFQDNFNVFSEQSLVDMDWSNIVVAGSAVVTALLPVPKEHSGSKKGLRKYYHEIVAPASDVDLFLYGLDEKQAIEKIKQVERSVKDALLTETTTVRTKNAITIASQYPTRHVQIVLRIYKSIAEILTGFDVDCACAAYDGTQVWASPRALTAYMRQANTIDLTRRSPSYENRLSKYSHRGFEVYWPDLDRSSIDPTIFERSFTRTVGLARLLVLEKLPSQSEREAYQEQRRKERGRPAINRYHHHYASGIHGNIKEAHEDEVAEWVEQDEVSDYHTFTIPYGPKYHAKKIEKLLYTKDLLLNVEWNNEERLEEINLHRHPAFFGTVEDVIGDCCGFCPEPINPEEEQMAEEESRTFVSGKISFIQDNPGRQAIGSFSPITDTDWTEMAYVGNTARLCQAIVDGDLDTVSAWLSNEDSDPNTRDYTGRTPLHLAVQSSTAEVVQCLVDHGARLIARLADGRTALHLACARGNLDMVKILLLKSEANEAEEEEKVAARRKSRTTSKTPDAASSEGVQSSDDDVEMIDAEEVEDACKDVEMQSTMSATSASFVKVENEELNEKDSNLDENQDDPDIYDINVVAWDVACTPLHIAIAEGNIAVAKELVQAFGADVLLPVKLFNSFDKSPRAAILTLVLALNLPFEKARDMALALLQLGASSAQADMKQTTALHYYIANKSEAVSTLFENDEPAVRRAINQLSVGGSSVQAQVASPLTTAIAVRDSIQVLKLLEAGAKPMIDFGVFMKAVLTRYENYNSYMTSEQRQDQFNESVEQPIFIAVEAEQPAIALELLRHGADPNTLSCDSYRTINRSYYYWSTSGQTLLEFVEKKLHELGEYKGERLASPPTPLCLDDEKKYFEGVEEGSYKFWVAKTRLDDLKRQFEKETKSWKEKLEKASTHQGMEEKAGAIRALAAGYEELEAGLHERNAKKFKELYPDFDKSENGNGLQPQHSSKPETFKVKFDFRVPDLTDESREAYLRIFEAAWAGDLSTIKAFTTELWGMGSIKEHSPLKIAVQDGNEGFSPFSLAVLRGHMDIARSILEIAQMQFQVRPPSRFRYTMDTDSEEDGSQAEEVDDDQVNIQSAQIDDVFTIENIGEIPMEVKSNISPLQLFNWPSQISKLTGTKFPASDIIEYAITSGDEALLITLLDLANHYAQQNASGENYHFFATPHRYLETCIRRGQTNLLAQLMSRTVCGVSLENLVTLSGVEIREKPKYYQGLSVYGKKRKDWADAGRGMQGHTSKMDRPPVLDAAYKGKLGSLKWFLSDVPAQCYSEFAKNNASDERIRHIAKAEGGFERVISKFLATRLELVIHAAVLRVPSPESLKVLQHLIKRFPEFLEVKNSSGWTPLYLSFHLHRYPFARLLIDAGANQTARDSQGNNILHALLIWNKNKVRTRTAKGVRLMMDLIDPQLRASLSTERAKSDPGSLTPLAKWVRLGTDPFEEQCAILKDLLGFPGKDDHLEMLDGAGDTPLHVLTKQCTVHLMRVVLEHNPLLVYRENAVGRTPLEMAEDICTAQSFKDPPHIPMGHNYVQKMIDRTPESFVDGKKEKDKRHYSGANCYSALNLCRDMMQKHPGKRRLVTLHEANEVAKRLAARQGKLTRSSQFGSQKFTDKSDEIDLWCANGSHLAEAGSDQDSGSD